MSKVKGRALAFVMAFCMMFTGVFQQGTLRVEAATEGTGTLTNCKIEIAGEELTEESVVKNGDPLSIEFNWQLDNNDQTSTEFVVDLGTIKGFSLNTMLSENPLKQGSETVGTYYIQDNKLYIKLDKEHKFFGENERYGGVIAEGIVQVNDADVSSDNKTPISVGTYTVMVKYDDNIADPVPWVSVDKALNGGLTEKADGLYQTFGATITANNAPVQNLTLTDTPGSGLSFPADAVITVAGGGVSGTYSSIDALNAALQGITLDKEQTIELSYEMKVSEEVYKEDASFSVKNNTLKVEYTPKDSEEKKSATDSVEVVVTDAPDINKVGTLSSDQKTATWTITIDLGKYYEEGKSLADMLAYVQDTPGEGFTNTELANLDLSQFTDKGNGVYTYQYQTTVKDSYLESTANIVLKNNVSMQVKENGYTYTDVGTVDLVGDSWITKKAQTKVDANGYIVWDVTLDIPDGVTDVVLWDEIQNKGDHAFVEGVYVDGKMVRTAKGVNYNLDGVFTKDAVGILVDSYGNPVVEGAACPYGMDIRLSNDYVQTNSKIVVTYKTKITNDSVKEFFNGVKVEYKCPVIGSTSHYTEDKFVDTTQKVLLKKSAALGSDGYSVDYDIRVDLSKRKDWQINDQIVVVDTLPKGMIWDESVDLVIKSGHVGGPWSNVSRTTSKEILADGRQKVEFVLTLNEENVNALYGSYDYPGICVKLTARIDEQAEQQKLFDTGSLTYKNEADVTYGTLTADAEATITVPAPSVVDKIGIYDSHTAPDCNYVIEINKECIDLIDGDTLMGIDTMGDLVTYRRDSVKVEKNVAGEWVTLDPKNGEYSFSYSEDASGRCLVFNGLPDATHLRISYWARIEQTDGKEFVGDAGNSFVLKGTNNSSVSSDTVMMTASVQVSGWAGSRVYDIYLSKFWTDGAGQMEALNGAEFRVEKMAVTADGQLVTDEVIDDNVVIGEEDEQGIKGLTLNNIYALYETKAPMGCELNPEPYYLVLQESAMDLSAVDSSYKINRFTYTSTIWYENEKAYGDLELQKTFADIDETDINAANISFTITPQIGAKKTYKLSEFDHVDGTTTYTRLFEDVPIGEYKIVENRIDMGGYTFKEMTYTVTSSGVQQSAGSEGTSVTGTQMPVMVNNGTITTLAVKNTYVENISINGSKVWNHGWNMYQPTQITVNLLANKEEVDEVVVTAANGWNWSFTDLSPIDENGETITYTVSEDVVTDYSTSIAGDAEAGFVITNTYSGVRTITVTKVWDDDNNRDGIRPTNIKVQLYADSAVQGEEVALNEDNDWTYTWENLPVRSWGTWQTINYTVQEVGAVEGYTSEAPTGSMEKGFKITNKHAYETINLSVEKIWDDADNQDGKRPEKISVKLLANGEEKESAILTADGGWKHTFDDLPKNEAGTAIIYTIEEMQVIGYDAPVIVPVIAEGVQTGFTITNKRVPATTQVSVEKLWNDADNQDGLRPTEITIKLLGGEQTFLKTVTKDSEGKWKCTFEDLPVYKDGQAIVYTVEEETVPGYGEPQIVPGLNNSYTITNTRIIDISVKKEWDDADNQDGKRPESVQVQLKGDGIAIGDAVTLDELNNWSHKWSGLPLSKEGQTSAIVYTVVEVDAPDAYEEPVVSGSAKDGFIIKNVHAPETTEVKVKKVWSGDNDNESGNRPETITVKLLAGGEVKQTATVKASDNWEYSFKNLAKYENGEEIKYTVSEEAVKNYVQDSLEKTAE
ncbi:MAG: Cna B-type domain-containing protein, partial [Lachnospiraceae bacterium]|nr:Cna B-type domain-containing protein [Lachnospiraceae bacterium]